METLFEIFGHLCGQQIDHTWMPGGLPLPVCQRCTGLYVGAALALGLLLGFRPRLEGRFLVMHGLFLLGTAPFGCHWIPHGPAVRTMTGLWFGAVIVVFLSVWPLECLRLRLGQRRRPRPERPIEGEPGRRAWPYYLALTLASGGLPLVCQDRSPGAASVILGVMVAGGLGLVVLLIFNLLAAAWWLARQVPRSHWGRLAGGT